MNATCTGYLRTAFRLEILMLSTRCWQQGGPEGPAELPRSEYAQFGLPSFLQPVGTTRDAATWTPRLWLTTIGRDGYWPVTVLNNGTADVLFADDPTQPDKRTVRAAIAQPDDYSVHFSLGWTTFWLISTVITLLLAFLVARPEVIRRSEILMRFARSDSPQRSKLLFFACMLVLACQTVFVIPAAAWSSRFKTFSRGIGETFNGLDLVMICYLVSVAALGLASFYGFQKRNHPKLGKSGAAACAVAFVAVAALAVVMREATLPTRVGSFLFRFVHLDSGVSPCLPLVFILLAWLWWAWQTLTGIVSLENKYIALPSRNDFDSHAGAGQPMGPEKIASSVERVRLKALTVENTFDLWTSMDALPRKKQIITPAIAGFALILLLMWPPEIAQAFEGAWYKHLYWILLYSCLFLVCFLISHIVGLWLEFRALLQAIETVPFRRGFADIRYLTWKPLWKLAGSGMNDFYQLLRGELAALAPLKECVKDHKSFLEAVKQAEKHAEEAALLYDSRKEKNDEGKTIQELFQVLQSNLSKVASEALIFANKKWNEEGLAPLEPMKKDAANEKDGGSKGDDDVHDNVSYDKPPQPESPARDRCTRRMEHFLCLFYLNTILVPLRRLQTLILAMAGVFVFVLLSYSNYPFESRESFHVLLISVFFVISLVVGIVYGQMYTNPLLSRITSNKPGELGFDFWVRMATFVFVPLLSLLSVQFPEINSFLFSWLQPALQSIK